MSNAMTDQDPSGRSGSLSPRDFASALGVSESSVKRWVDAGHIVATKTVGGHRRIALSEAVRYVRSHSLPIIRPEVLGLDLALNASPSESAVDDQLHSLLVAGEDRQARGLLVSRFLAGESLADLIDGALGEALRRIGRLYRSRGDEGVFIEHRASEIVQHALREIQTLLGDSGGPVALGGAVPEDMHSLPSLAASVVLRAEGLDTTSLGANTPFAARAHAIAARDPKLVWVSISHVADRGLIECGLRETADLLARRSAFLIVGGCATNQVEIPTGSTVYLARRMGDLAAFARALTTP